MEQALVHYCEAMHALQGLHKAAARYGDRASQEASELHLALILDMGLVTLRLAEEAEKGGDRNTGAALCGDVVEVMNGVLRAEPANAQARRLQENAMKIMSRLKAKGTALV